MDPIHVVITIIALLAAVVVMRWARHDFVAWPYFYVAPLALAIVIIAGFVPWYVKMLGLAGLVLSIIAIEKMSRVDSLKVVAATGVALVVSPSIAFGFGLVPTSISLPEPPTADIVNPIEPLNAAAVVTVPAVDGGTDEAPLVGMDAVVREDIIEGTDTKELFSMMCGYSPETGKNTGVALYGEMLDCLENGDSDHADVWIETTEAMQAANPGTNEFGFNLVTTIDDVRKYAEMEAQGLFDPGVVVVQNMPNVSDDEARLSLLESGDFPTLDRERAMRLPVVHREGPITNTASMAFGEMPFFEDNAQQIRLALGIPTIDPIGGAPMSTSVSTGFVPDLDVARIGYGTYAECLNPTLPPRKPPAPPEEPPTTEPPAPPTTPPTEPPTEEPPTEEPPTEEPPTTEPPTEEPPTEEPTPTPTPEEPTPTPTPTPSPEPESFPACTGLTDDGEEMIEHFPTQEEADEARVDCELKDKDPSKSPINGGDEDGEFTPAPSPDPDEGELEEHQEPTPAPTPGAEDDQNDSVIEDEEADPVPADREDDVDPPATNVPDEPTDPGDNIDPPEGESNPFPGSTITDPVGPVLETESNTEGGDGGSGDSGIFDDFEPADEVDPEDGEMSLGEQLGALLAPILLGGGALQSRRKVAIKG